MSDKFVKELESAFEAGQISDCITLAEAQKLPYHQARIKEAMRLHPSLDHSQSRLVPDVGVAIGERYLLAQVCI